MRRRSVQRESEARLYSERAKDYLVRHPFCQATLLLLHVSEPTDRIAYYNAEYPGAIPAMMVDATRIPLSREVHHRNKRRGARLLDDRYWLAVCPEMHRRIERNKTWARQIGLLLPLEADADGRLPDGSTCPMTEELLTAGMGA